MDLELREKHEKLWFDIILRALNDSVRAQSTVDIDELKEQFFDENGIHDIPIFGCYLCQAYSCSVCPLTINGNICMTLYKYIGDYNLNQQIVIYIYIATCFLELEGSSEKQCREYAFKRLYEIGAKKPRAMARLKEIERSLSEVGLL